MNGRRISLALKRLRLYTLYVSTQALSLALPPRAPNRATSVRLPQAMLYRVATDHSALRSPRPADLAHRHRLLPHAWTDMHGVVCDRMHPDAAANGSPGQPLVR